MNAPKLKQEFDQELRSPLRPHLVGRGRLERTSETLRLVNAGTSSEHYSNAQIDDYEGLPRRNFLWSPPLTLTVRARFSHAGSGSTEEARFLPGNRVSGNALTGTAGFGFWNDPFLMTNIRPPALPRAIWFFYASPPSNMKLDMHTPGCGWKAATIDAQRWSFLALAPTIPLAVPLMHVDAAYRRLWPIGQRAINVSEALVDSDMAVWHTYVIEWGTKTAHFLVDDRLVLACKTPPRGPLGLVIWLDNQSMVVTPQGRIHHALLAQPEEQWLELESVVIS